MVLGARARLDMFWSVFRAYLWLVGNQPRLRRQEGSPRLLESELEYINF